MEDRIKYSNIRGPEQVYSGLGLVDFHAHLEEVEERKRQEDLFRRKHSLNQMRMTGFWRG